METREAGAESHQAQDLTRRQETAGLIGREETAGLTGRAEAEKSARRQAEAEKSTGRQSETAVAAGRQTPGTGSPTERQEREGTPAEAEADREPADGVPAGAARAGGTPCRRPADADPTRLADRGGGGRDGRRPTAGSAAGGLPHHADDTQTGGSAAGMGWDGTSATWEDGRRFHYSGGDVFGWPGGYSAVSRLTSIF